MNFVILQLKKSYSSPTFLNHAFRTYAVRSAKNQLVLQELLDKHEKNIFYSTYLEKKKLKLGYAKKIVAQDQLRKRENKRLLKTITAEPLPLALKYVIGNDVSNKCEDIEKPQQQETKKILHFPFKDHSIEKLNCEGIESSNNTNDFEAEVRTRLELYNSKVNPSDWMCSYENYEANETEVYDTEWKVNYGTPNPNSRISDTPCSGCGALLHCKDTSIPGYIPSEIFHNYSKPGGTDLEAIVCQRCHFLNNYNIALQVRVAPETYPQVLSSIAQHRSALVLLIVDLLDFPCSIWTGIADLIGHNRPIVVVGNKVDLLPQDGKGYLEKVKSNLMNAVHEQGFGMSNIKDVALISAKSGFGIEELVTKLQSLWQYKGDVFLVGCTNVGKSTLFNTLLQSDYCKSQASDLIQRATTSVWPGTTLNLLKFPILRPSGWRLYVRQKRLMSARKLVADEAKLRRAQFKKTGDKELTSLIGHIDRSFKVVDPVEASDAFAVKGSSQSQGRVKVGIDEYDEDYVMSKWCFDTPGVVQSDQIIHLLTTEELVQMFPKELIVPQTYSLQPGSSIYLGGLARLDYLEGDSNVRFTVFCAETLPITICKLDRAEELYQDFLGTDVFAVPTGYPERLRLWPGLKHSKNMTVTGIDRNQSAIDVVLSSAGWISVTPDCGVKVTFQAWTPEGRGIYLRDSLLPAAVSRRGHKLRGSCTYSRTRLVNR